MPCAPFEAIIPETAASFPTIISCNPHFPLCYLHACHVAPNCPGSCKWSLSASELRWELVSYQVKDASGGMCGTNGQKQRL